eukprot:maker-scaffold311_size212931-snap-gene-0.8 protein:Tk00657 transcript:maker-scaffold311_size212931-snap-gene-0.8-mRNA-1 annotation:"PREDICTED: uncharacterized protein LOC101895962"
MGRVINTTERIFRQMFNQYLSNEEGPWIGDGDVLKEGLVNHPEQVCPKYTRRGFEKQDDLRVQISFGMQQGKVIFGRIVRQELELINLDGESVGTLVWNRSDLGHSTFFPPPPGFQPPPLYDGGQMIFDFKIFSGLKLREVYVPRIKVISEVNLPQDLIVDGGYTTNYQTISTVVQECKGEPVLECMFWQCKNGQEIHIDDICTESWECDDGSDEDPELCKGGSGILLTIFTITLGVYYLGGFLTWAILSWDSDPSKPNPNELELQTSSLFPVVTTIKGIIEDENYERVVSLYEDMKEDEGVQELFWILHNFPTTQYLSIGKIVQTIFAFEVSHHSKGEEEGPTGLANSQSVCHAIQFWKSQCDPSLLSWILTVIDESCFYRWKMAFKLYISQKFSRYPKVNNWIFRSRVPFILSTFPKVGFFYLDVLKDIGALFILRYIAEELFQHHYATIGNINLDAIQYFLLSVLLGSQFAIFMLSVGRFNEMNMYGKGKRFPRMVQNMAFVFPVHFVLLERARLKGSIHHQKDQLHETLIRLLGTPEDLPETQRDHSNQFKCGTVILKDLEHDLKAVQIHYNRMQIIETVIERVPQIVVQMTLFLASQEYPRLKAFFANILKHQVGLSGQFVFTLALLSSFMGVINSVRHFKNEKRFPLTPSLMGTLIQMAAICALLGPKMFLVSSTLIHVPFILPVVIVFGLSLIILYQKLMFASVSIFSFSHLVTFVSLAFYAQPTGVEKDKALLKDLANTLDQMAGVPHTIVLSCLSYTMIYLPIAIATNDYLFAVYRPSYFTNYFLHATILYFVGLILYLALNMGFYLLGHNWKTLMKNHPSVIAKKQTVIKIFRPSPRSQSPQNK